MAGLRLLSDVSGGLIILINIPLDFFAVTELLSARILKCLQTG